MQEKAFITQEVTVGAVFGSGSGDLDYREVNKLLLKTFPPPAGYQRHFIFSSVDDAV